MTTTSTPAVAKPVLTSLHGREIGLDATRSLVVKAMHRGWSFSAAPGSANVSVVSLQACDNEGFPVLGVRHFDLYLSDSAAGAGLTATTASGAVANDGTKGADLGAYTAKKALRCQTNANGQYNLSITDTAKSLFYVCAQIPGHGAPAVSSQLVAGNYG